MRFIVAAKEQEGGVLTLCYLGGWPTAALKYVAKACHEEDFDLMFEFDRKPAMANLVLRVENRDGISSMPSMKRLWVLDAENL